MYENIDPNGPASNESGIFGLPYSDDARVILIPAPWEATVSYGSGASRGPEAILQSSRQVDLHDHELKDFYKAGISLLPADQRIAGSNVKAKKQAQKVINGLTEGKDMLALQSTIDGVNAASEEMNTCIYTQAKTLLDQQKIVGLIGGDHSTPFGTMKAHVETFPDMGILHIDAHCDLRNAYEGFTYSHASIMHNILHQSALKRLVQVGIRDYCKEEAHVIEQSSDRIRVHFMQDIRSAEALGETWDEQCKAIASDLPDIVYISFDIDGLDATLCPGTGTPVPGGFSFAEIVHLLKVLVREKKKIVGFDLVEVSPQEGNEWDGNVGARMLFQLIGWTLRSQGIS